MSVKPPSRGGLPHGYTVTADDFLYEGTHTRTLRIRREGTPGKTQLLKVPLVATNLGDVAALQEERGILRQLGRDTAPALAEGESAAASHAFTCPDTGGRPLSVLNRGGAHSPADVLWIARGLVERIQGLHALRIVHKDLNADNVLVDPETRNVDLISHDMCSRIPRDGGQIVHPGRLPGHLAYISPEQTGRMNRAIGYRSDFYSVGAIIYQMLTGAPPFRGSDPVELVHAHIARAVVPAHERAPKVPLGLSAIASKLMSKNAEDRYQSAVGILDDLAHCQQQLDQLGDIPAFELATTDISERFQVPQRLYGREDDLALLMEAFARVGDGHAEMVLVSGYSGIGKSALVREIHRPVTEREGFFAAGKHDQYKRNVPYSAVSRAFANLVRQLLTESTASVAAWRERFIATLGDNTPLIVDLVPDLALVVGQTQPVPDLPASEVEARLTSAFSRFLEIFASGDRPLVLFLDDLQWADGPSLKLLRHIASNLQHLRLLLICAYRDNEVDGAHPLVTALDDVRTTDLPVAEIVLRPLDDTSIRAIVDDTLRVSNALTEQLATILGEKTGGNPFFLLKAFESLYEDGLLRFDLAARSWILDEAGIRAIESTENVVDLMIGRLRRLPEATGEALQLAACIGNNLALETLATVMGTDTVETARAIWPAVEAGLLRPELVVASERRDSSSRPTLAVMELSPEQVRLRFPHDRVQQAAFELISAEERKPIRLRIGRQLRHSASPEQLDERIFDIAGHLAGAADLIHDPTERADVAALCLRAGQRARAATAYDAASSYLKPAIGLLGDSGWTTEPDLMMDLSFLQAQCIFFGGDLDGARAAFTRLLGRPLSNLQLARVHTELIAVAMQSVDYAQALEHTVAGLALLGTEIPPVEEADRLSAFIAEQSAVINRLLEGHDIAYLAELPAMGDPERLAESRVLELLSIVGMYFSPSLVSAAGTRLVRLSLEFGNAPASAPAYASHGVMQAAGAGQYEAGYEFGRMAIGLAQHQGDPSAEVVVRFWFGACNSHWRAHVRESVETLKAGTDLGLQLGVPIWTYYNAFFIIPHTLFGSENLAEVDAEAERYLPVLIDPQSYEGNACYLQYAKALRGQTDSLTGFEDDTWDDARIAQLKEQNSLLALQHYLLARMMSALAFGQTEAALDAADKAIAEGDISIVLFAQLAPARFIFHHALALLDGLRLGLAPDQHAAMRERLEGYRERLAGMAKNCLANFGAMHALVEAEWAVLEGDQLAALARFDEAIDIAAKHRMVYQEAISNERAARFHSDGHRERIAVGYFRAALQAFADWGATAKTRALLEANPMFLATADEVSAAQTEVEPESSGGLDMLSVLKAARIVSGEIELKRLLDRSMAVVIENAGAQRGVILLHGDDGLTVQGVADVDNRVAPSSDYARRVVDYCRRTQKSVVLAEAATHELFRTDPHIQATRPRSVLAVPLVNQGHLTGVLYLENRRSKDAFTSDRVVVLEAICAQLVISFENARLFEEQRLMAASFARFVPTEFLESLGKSSILEVRRGDAVSEEITVLFSDLRDFTKLSDKLDAHESFEILNRYLERMEPAIKANGGFIDKFIGDAIMALFRSPADAMRAAVAMHRALDHLNEEFEKDGMRPLRMGVGLHAGPLMLGTIGSHERIETTVIGDTVNMASRIEGLTARYGSRILVSERCLEQAGHPETLTTRLVGRVKVKGKAEAHPVHEMIDGDTPEVRDGKQASLKLFGAAVGCFEDDDFGEALELFRRCVAMCPEDRVAETYVARCRESLRY